MAIIAGAIANWFMLSIAFSIWFDLTKQHSSNPTLYATMWALILMGGLAGLALTPAGESLFRWMSGCRRPIRDEEDRLKPVFDDVCHSAKVNPDKYELYMSDDKFPNAFAMGRRTVCVTRSMLNSSSEEELQGVLAHELGHHVHGDAVQCIVFAMITLVGQVIMWGGWLVTKILSVFTAIGRSSNRDDDPAVIFQVFAGILWVVMWFFQLFVWIPIYIGAAFGSRMEEYQADKYAAEIGYGEGLLQSLNKMLDIDGHPSGFMGLLYRTHPATGDRIRALEDYEEARADQEDWNACTAEQTTEHDTPPEDPGRGWEFYQPTMKERFAKWFKLKRERVYFFYKFRLPWLFKRFRSGFQQPKPQGSKVIQPFSNGIKLSLIALCIAVLIGAAGGYILARLTGHHPVTASAEVPKIETPVPDSPPLDLFPEDPKPIEPTKPKGQPVVKPQAAVNAKPVVKPAKEKPKASPSKLPPRETKVTAPKKDSKTPPGNFFALMIQGDQYAKAGNHWEALKKYKQASALWPENKDAKNKVTKAHADVYWLDNTTVSIIEGDQYAHNSMYKDALRKYNDALQRRKALGVQDNRELEAKIKRTEQLIKKR